MYFRCVNAFIKSGDKYGIMGSSLGTIGVTVPFGRERLPL
jgi:hypothetical protein